MITVAHPDAAHHAAAAAAGPAAAVSDPVAAAVAHLAVAHLTVAGPHPVAVVAHITAAVAHPAAAVADPAAADAAAAAATIGRSGVLRDLSGGRTGAEGSPQERSAERLRPHDVHRAGRPRAKTREGGQGDDWLYFTRKYARA